jgi:hypothetical protein
MMMMILPAKPSFFNSLHQGVNSKLMKYHQDTVFGFFTTEERLDRLSELGNPLVFLAQHINFEFFRAPMEESLYAGADFEEMLEKRGSLSRIHFKALRGRPLNRHQRRSTVHTAASWRAWSTSSLLLTTLWTG